MDANELYGSKYLKCQDLNGQDIVARITNIELATFNDGKQQYLLTLDGYSKKLGLNRTNAQTLMHLYGPQTDAWKGKRITLHPDITQFQGRTVDCIRLKPASQKAATASDLSEAKGPLAGYTDRVMQQQLGPSYDDRPEPDDVFDPLG